MLLSYYKIFDNSKEFYQENSINNKKKVVAFLKEWCHIAKDAFYEDNLILQLLVDIANILRIESKIFQSLKDDLKTLDMILESDPYK